MLKRKARQNKGLSTVILLVCILMVGYVCAMAKINKLVTESCYSRLKQASEQMKWELNYQIDSDRKRLENLASIIETYEVLDSENTMEVLASNEGSGMIDGLGILYPDNTVLWKNGRFQDAPGMLDFAEIAARGSFISESSQSVLYQDREIIRLYVPVLEEGETAAILFGVIDLGKFPDIYTLNAYDGEVQLYLIEGTSGEFILDTWHGTLGNISDLDDRKAEKSFSVQEFENHMKNGGSGDIIFQSQSAGEKFYGHYDTVGINDWRMMITVPESVAFAETGELNRTFLQLIIFCIVVFVLYLAYSLRGFRRESKEKEKQLGQVQYMFDVEKLLFDAHRFPEKMTEALGRIGNELEARETFFAVIENRSIVKLHIWSISNGESQKDSGAWPGGDNVAGNDWKEADLADKMPFYWGMLKSGKSVVSKSVDDIKRDGAFLGKYSNLMMAPVRDGDGVLTGILGAANTRSLYDDAGMLECVEVSFSMALNNLKSYNTISRMGLMDYNTGLLNRNSYNRDLMNYRTEKHSSLACIYMDVNGLHEINNCLGHDAGDEMLRVIAREFAVLFGRNSTYRIGGDEFVALCTGLTLQEVKARVDELEQAVEDKNYHVSVGYAWQKADIKIEDLVREAEKNMYEKKHKFYEGEGNRRKTREMNRAIEDILTQKKDTEAFLAVLASRFLGVYVVDLKTDEARYIYIPEYFREMLKKAGGSFKKAFKMYAEECVASEYIDSYCSLGDFEGLAAKLVKYGYIELRYGKRDGTYVMLRVYQNNAFTEEHQETLWVYEL